MSSVTETGGEPALAVLRDRGEPSQPEARFSVLIADDSKVIRTRLVSILETLPGVELRVAADGLEALALAKERKPDLLLCDHEMPGMNGIEVLRELRQKRRHGRADTHQRQAPQAHLQHFTSCGLHSFSWTPYAN